jgi:phosphatidate cytidylyltransferase
MLKQRLVTAAILVTVFLLCLFALPIVFYKALILVAIAVAGWEFAGLAGCATRLRKALYTGSLVAATAAAAHLIHAYSQLGYGLWGLALAFWALAAFWVKQYPKPGLWRLPAMRRLAGLATLVPSGAALLWIVTLPHGPLWVLALVAIVALADSGAYFAGRAWGRHKLAPSVSPGKSWEGVLGGLLAVTLLVSLYAVLPWHPQGLAQLPVSVLFWAALPTALISVLGDLFESLLKRSLGVKDSGQLLPGHGGVLDRIDGLTAAAPLYALVLLVCGIL